MKISKNLFISLVLILLSFTLLNAQTRATLQGRITQLNPNSWHIEPCSFVPVAVYLKVNPALVPPNFPDPPLEYVTTVYTNTDGYYSTSINPSNYPHSDYSEVFIMVGGEQRSAPFTAGYIILNIHFGIPI